MNTPPHRALTLATGALALVIVTLTAQALAAVPARSAAAHRSAGSSTGWRLDKVISFPHRSVLLFGVDAVSDDDAWVAGMTYTESGTKELPLIEHWDGRSWRRVVLPAKAASLLDRLDTFGTVGASSARNVWAVSTRGRYLRLSGDRWTIGALPGSRSGLLLIESVDAFSATDVWAFGGRLEGSTTLLRLKPYAARFNGRRWITVRVPGGGFMGPVSAISARDMWAAGGEQPLGTAGTVRVLQWNGSAWREAPVQPAMPRQASVTAVLATKDSNVWIGGSVPNSKQGTSEMAQHWNGKTWSASSPHAPATTQDYSLVSFAKSPGALWALGSKLGGPTRIWRNSGGKWTLSLVSPNWLYHLADVPGTTSTWGIGWNAALTEGLIVLHGPVPH